MLDTDDLNQIQGLMAYLDKAFDPATGTHDLSADVRLSDSNGNYVGKIQFYDGRYTFMPWMPGAGREP
jgi:hypothetical protein